MKGLELCLWVVEEVARGRWWLIVHVCEALSAGGHVPPRLDGHRGSLEVLSPRAVDEVGDDLRVTRLAVLSLTNGARPLAELCLRIYSFFFGRGGGTGTGIDTVQSIPRQQRAHCALLVLRRQLDEGLRGDRCRSGGGKCPLLRTRVTLHVVLLLLLLCFLLRGDGGMGAETSPQGANSGLNATLHPCVHRVVGWMVFLAVSTSSGGVESIAAAVVEILDVLRDECGDEGLDEAALHWENDPRYCNTHPVEDVFRSRVLNQIIAIVREVDGAY